MSSRVAPPLDALQADGFDDDFALRLVTTVARRDEIERGAAARRATSIDVHVGEDECDDRGAAAGRAVQIAPTPDEAPATGRARRRASAGRCTRQRRVRIDLRRLDTLMNLIGELVIARGRLTQLAGRARTIRRSTRR